MPNLQGSREEGWRSGGRVADHLHGNFHRSDRPQSCDARFFNPQLDEAASAEARLPLSSSNLIASLTERFSCELEA